MFIPIEINLDNLVEEFDLNPTQIKLLGTELINHISDKYFSAIRQRVNTTLRKTRGVYLQNLKIETIDPFTKEIVLTGWLPNALESGVDTFDMKPGFMGAKNVRISAKGNWYTTIPFQWSKSGGENGGNKIPSNIYQIVKSQNTSLKSNQIPESSKLQQIKDLAKGIGADKKKIEGTYQHKSDIHIGIQKSKNTNGQVSFRRVGAVSDQNSFWHPGIQQRDFFGKGLMDIEGEIPVLSDKIIDDFLASQGF